MPPTRSVVTVGQPSMIELPVDPELDAVVGERVEVIGLRILRLDLSLPAHAEIGGVDPGAGRAAVPVEIHRGIDARERRRAGEQGGGIVGGNGGAGAVVIHAGQAGAVRVAGGEDRHAGDVGSADRVVAAGHRAERDGGAREPLRVGKRGDGERDGADFRRQGHGGGHREVVHPGHGGARAAQRHGDRVEVQRPAARDGDGRDVRRGGGRVGGLGGGGLGGRDGDDVFLGEIVGERGVVVLRRAVGVRVGGIEARDVLGPIADAVAVRVHVLHDHTVKGAARTAGRDGDRLRRAVAGDRPDGGNRRPGGRGGQAGRGLEHVLFSRHRGEGERQSARAVGQST